MATIIFAFVVVIALATVDSQTNYRGDQVAEISSSEWYEGTWTNFIYCSGSTYAFGYRMRVEGDVWGDDTAANAIELQCGNLGDHHQDSTIKPHNGLYGDWGIYTHCDDTGYINGFQSKVEYCFRCRDKTALNSVKIKCDGGDDHEVSNAGPWGNYPGEWSLCPSGSLVCGVKVRFDENGLDDTGLNAVQFACCASSIGFTYLTAEWMLISDYISDTGSHTYQKKYGVESSSTTSFTTEYFNSLEVQVEAGFEWKSGASGGVQVTTTNMIQQSYKKYQEVSISYTCSDRYLYQFAITGKESIGGTFDLKSNSYLCTNDYNPTCPPNHCDSNDCSSCQPSDYSISLQPTFISRWINVLGQNPHAIMFIGSLCIIYLCVMVFYGCYSAQIKEQKIYEVVATISDSNDIEDHHFKN